MSVVIKHATNEDCDELFRISSAAHSSVMYKQLIPISQYGHFKRRYRYSEKRNKEFSVKMRRYVASKYYVVFVAKHEGVVCGFAVTALRVYGLELKSLFVHPKWQGQQIGARLFDAQLSPARGGDTVHLKVLQGNQRAIELYEVNGFCTARRSRKRFYGAPLVNMEKRQLSH